jgi:hypothetical protein
LVLLLPSFVLVLALTLALALASVLCTAFCSIDAKSTTYSEPLQLMLTVPSCCACACSI